MSFILDALRKSEHERQRQAGPAIADLSVARPAPRPPYALLAIAALLAVNLVVVGYFLLRDDPPAPVAAPVAAPAPAAAAAAPPVVPPAAAEPAPGAASAGVSPLATVAVAGSRPPVPDASPPAAPDPLLLPPAVARASPPPTAVAERPPRVAYSDDVLPRLDMLPPQSTAGLPVLNLDLHIYASDPAQRAAFINGRRYREGDTLPEGVEITAITPEGAVLRHRGQRFLLPRP